MIYKQGHVTDGLDHPFMVKHGKTGCKWQNFMIQEEGAERGEGKYWTMIITNASDRVGKKVTINFTKCRQLTATSASWWVQTCREREKDYHDMDLV